MCSNTTQVCFVFVTLYSNSKAAGLKDFVLMSKSTATFKNVLDLVLDHFRLEFLEIDRKY